MDDAVILDEYGKRLLLLHGRCILFVERDLPLCERLACVDDIGGRYADANGEQRRADDLHRDAGAGVPVWPRKNSGNPERRCEG